MKKTIIIFAQKAISSLSSESRKTILQEENKYKKIKYYLAMPLTRRKQLYKDTIKILLCLWQVENKYRKIELRFSCASDTKDFQIKQIKIK